MSSYVAVFGRERNLPGLPYAPPHECLSAVEFCRLTEENDRRIAHALNEAHAKAQTLINSRRTPRPPFAPGDWVWLQRPRGVTGPKLDHWWTGPYRVKARTGQSSYELTLGPNQTHDAHLDQLKPCQWDMELGDSYPLVWRRADGRSVSSSPVPSSITGHRYSNEVGWEFLTAWSQDPEAPPSWEPATKFFQGCDELWMRYILENGIDLILESEPP